MPITKELIKEYKKDKSVYFETGTWEGGGVQLALDTGFETVYSVEIDDSLYNSCQSRFNNHKEAVFLALGSSANVLEDISSVQSGHPLNNESCFIYLDAHPMCDLGEVPLIAELKAISKLKRNDHTIIIDDFRLIRDAGAWGKCFEGKDMKKELNELLLVINKNYQISYHADGWDEEDLIVATLD